MDALELLNEIKNQLRQIIEIEGSDLSIRISMTEDAIQYICEGVFKSECDPNHFYIGGIKVKLIEGSSRIIIESNSVDWSSESYEVDQRLLNFKNINWN